MAAALTVGPAQVEGSPFEGWSRPVVVELQVYRAPQGERLRRMTSPRQDLQVPAGGDVELEVRGVDQFGREFPRERMVIGFEPVRECEGLIRIRDRGEGRYTISGGTRRGRCGIVFWVPGNLNLEWPLRVEVTGVARQGYTREQSEIIARALYSALLGRAPDPTGLSAAIAEIQRGRVSSQVDGMLRSGEFTQVRAGMTPQALLEQFYRGLLTREPDSAGVRRYLGDVERGRFARVIADIIQSEEFEARLLEPESPRRRRR